MIFISAKIFKRRARNILVAHIDNTVTPDCADSFTDAAEFYESAVQNFLAHCEDKADSLADTSRTPTVHAHLTIAPQSIGGDTAVIELRISDGSTDRAERHTWKRMGGRWLVVSCENLHDGHNI